MKNITLIVLASFFLFSSYCLADEQECQQRMGQIKRQLWIASLCKIDTDCVGASLGCPFGCETSLNKAQRKEIETIVRTFRKDCVTCEYGCLAPEGELKCVAGRCERVSEKQKQPTKRN